MTEPGPHMKIMPVEDPPGDHIGLDVCILLAGGLVPSPLVKMTHRLTLELWLSAHETVFGRWCDVLAELAEHAEIPKPSIRVVHSGPPFEPSYRLADERFDIQTMAEPDGYRGPAGVLRDVMQNDPPDTTILVAEAARYIAGGLDTLYEDWVRLKPDVLVAKHPDGSPAGLMMMRASALKLVQDTGFMDIKEQWLPKCVEAGLEVWTSETTHFRPYPLRTLEQYLSASAASVGKTCPIEEMGPVLGPLKPLPRQLEKSRIADDAEVARDAVVADAIIMPGAKVETGAIVVRSLVCPGAIVPAGAEVVDMVVAAD